MVHAVPWIAACALFVCALAALPGSGDDAGGLGAIKDEGADVEKLAGGFKFTEGPVWDPRGFLVFSDIPADTLHKWTPGGKVEVFRQPSGQANGNTRDREGRLITCEHKNRRVSRTEKDGTVTTLAERYEGKRLNSPNDVVVRSDGSIYFTDPPYGLPKQTEGKELDWSGVYRLSKDGTLALLARDFARPNGLAFSPDEKKLYVDDSQEGHIRVFDVRPDGMLANGRVFAELKAPGKQGVPDGMKVDVQGNVYCTGPGGVWIFSPQGTLRGKIIAPEVPANLGWGDSDYRTLYITAKTGLYRIRLKVAGVHPG